MKEKDLLTHGPVRKKIILFTLPILLGHIFQQLYSTIDSFIVGNFVGDNALAAVTSSGNVLWLVIGFFSGLAVGAGIIISRYIGAQDREKTEEAVATTITLGLITSVFLTIFGLLISEPLLRLIQTPAEVFPDSLMYFNCYFLGISGMIMYNLLAGVMQAAGDSRHPLVYLVIASIVNILLDLLFVAVFRWGVAGAAIATAISQLISAVLACIHLLRVDADYRLQPKKLRLYKSCFAEILRLGIPVGLQDIIIQISNVMIQSFINGYGYAAVAGLGTFQRIEGFAFLPIVCFGMAMSTFVSQNLGAKKHDRVQKGVRFGVAAGFLMAEGIGLLCTAFAVPLMRLFTRDPDVIAYGVWRAEVCGPFFFALAISNIMASVLEGFGKTKETTIAYMICWCFMRVLILNIVRQFTDWFGILNWIYPITWCLTIVVMVGLYLWQGFQSKKEAGAD